jgi:hypothetical protein
MKTLPAGVFALVMALLVTQSGGQAQSGSADALPYSTGYLITGDYVAAGVDTTAATEPGFATGTIHVSGVPANADILAAFLYWEVVYELDSQLAGVKFRGAPVPAARKAVPPLTQATPCFASGSVKIAMFRADVLPFLPVQRDAAGDKTGKRLVNDADLSANIDPDTGQPYPLHTVRLPQANGNNTPESAGASLVVIYRDPTEPLRKIVLYDGGYIQPRGVSMTQNLRGFYQSSTAKSARLTHIAGSGQPNHSDQLFFNNNQIGAGIEQFVETGSASNRSWFTKTLGHAQIDSLMQPLPAAPTSGYGETATTSVTHTSASPYGCMAWAAVAFSTAVKDADTDGLPDGLEDATDGLINPNGEPLPNLHAMGASSSHKDLFVEVNAMQAANGTTYGGVADADGHNHLPTPEVLKMVGDAYANASVVNPDSSTGIKAHFDVGGITAYHGLGGDYASTDADAYLVGFTGNAGDVPRGGEQMLERACVPSATVKCEFPDYPGTVAWKFGFLGYRNAPVGPGGAELTPAQEAYCLTNPTGTVDGIACGRRRFDRIRSEFFHYALYAHARAKPKSTFPCLDATNHPAEYVGGACASPLADNPDFKVPKSISGSADLPGGNLLITLGLWDNFTGTPFVQASTTLHELGHNLNLGHGGFAPSRGSATLGTTTYIEPNCKPNYLSSMSYLFQVYGLFRDDDDGRPHLDYSSAPFGVGAPLAFNENALDDGQLGPTTPSYRPAWFAPAGSNLAAARSASAATRFCSGSKFNPASPPVPMARIEAGSVGESIDWNGDGLTNSAGPQNVKFGGTYFDGVTGGDEIPPSVLYGYDDWSNIQLNQIGAGRGAARFKNFETLTFDGSTFEGSTFEGSTFEGSTFEGSTFEGSTFEGSTFEGSTFEGSTFEGSTFEGSTFEGSTFEGSTFEGSTFEGVDLDYESAKALGRARSHGFKACVIGGTGLDACVGVSTPLHRIKSDWNIPSFGTAAAYDVRRVLGTTVGATSTKVLVEEVSAPTLTLSAANDELPNGVQFTFFNNIVYDDAASGPDSNYVTLTAVNSAPTAIADPTAANAALYSTSAGVTLSVDAAHGVLVNDTDEDSSVASIKAVPFSGLSAHGGTVILFADGRFTYTPAAGFAGTDTFTYRANDGIWGGDGSTPMSANSDPATVTITVVDVTPPLVTLTVPAPTGSGGYFKTSPVGVGIVATDPSTVISIACTDNGSPIAVGGLTGMGTTTAGGSLSVGGEGTHNLVCLATDGLGNGPGAAPGSTNTGTVKIDTVPPVTTFTSGPSEGAELAYGAGLGASASVTFAFSTVDPNPGSGVASIQCQLDTGAFSACTSPRTISGLSLGAHTFSVRATDVAGNVAVVTRTFKVVYAFTFSALKSPAQLGSAVPINFQLKDPLGNVVTTLTATVPMIKMESVFNGPAPSGGCTVKSATGTSEVLYSPATGATGGSNFRFVSGGYQFNWDTTTAKTNPIITGVGCYTVVITLSDGSAPKLVGPVQLK